MSTRKGTFDDGNADYPCDCGGFRWSIDASDFWIWGAEKFKQYVFLIILVLGILLLANPV